MKLKTLNLDLEELSLRQWKQFYQEPDQLELFLGVESPPHLMDANYRREYMAMLPKLLKLAETNEKDLCWYTQWIFIHRQDKLMIGGFNFAGPPTEDGGVYISYFVSNLYNAQNYVAEALRALVRWAFQEKQVRYIVAETARGDLPSARVFEDVGFQKQQQGDEMIPWILISNKSV